MFQSVKREWFCFLIVWSPFSVQSEFHRIRMFTLSAIILTDTVLVKGFFNNTPIWGVGCTRIVEMIDSSSLSIECKCGNTFCWKCSQAAHHPAPCKVILNSIYNIIYFWGIRSLGAEERRYFLSITFQAYRIWKEKFAIPVYNIFTFKMIAFTVVVKF